MMKQELRHIKDMQQPERIIAAGINQYRLLQLRKQAVIEKEINQHNEEPAENNPGHEFPWIICGCRLQLFQIYREDQGIGCRFLIRMF